MEKALRQLWLLLLSAALVCGSVGRCAAFEWESPIILTALHPTPATRPLLASPILFNDAGELLAEKGEREGQEPPLLLPDHALLLDQAPNELFIAPELPRLPDLEEIPPPPPVKPPPKYWTYRFEFGVNGAEGNSRFFNTRTGAKIKRKTDRHILTIDWYHALALNKSVRSKNETVAEWRWEAIFPDSPWSTFLHNTNEYDEFTGWDFRLQGDGGLSYWFLRSDTTKLQARAGAGISREIGGEDTDSIPEASSGLDFEHRLTHKQRLDAKLDVYPDVRNLNKYRARMNGGWEIQIDEADHLSLRFSVQDRFDSTPDTGKRPNDFTYSAQLVWDY